MLQQAGPLRGLRKGTLKRHKRKEQEVSGTACQSQTWLMQSRGLRSLRECQLLISKRQQRSCLHQLRKPSQLCPFSLPMAPAAKLPPQARACQSQVPPTSQQAMMLRHCMAVAPDLHLYRLQTLQEQLQQPLLPRRRSGQPTSRLHSGSASSMMQRHR